MVCIGGGLGTINALNVVFAVKERRPTWKRIAVSLAVFLLILVVAIVYYAAPNVKQPFRIITPGAVIAVTAWIGASVAFAYYVQNFASYNKTYGSMGALSCCCFISSCQPR